MTTADKKCPEDHSILVRCYCGWEKSGCQRVAPDCTDEQTEPHLCPLKEAGGWNGEPGELCTCCDNCETDCYWNS